MDTIPSICAPENNVSVMASAGTGKTWLLITRLVRLLLDGAQADSILAISFTRKASAEMRSRLSERLFEFLTLTDVELAETLRYLGIKVTEQSCTQARSLYERLLRSDQQIQITTFHAFCQSILRRFPIEANIPPGFEIFDNSGLIAQEAWDTLLDEATQSSDTQLEKALDVLIDNCGGIVNTKSSANDFLQHRSDWWAYTDGQNKPCTYASQALATSLDISSNENPYEQFFTEGINQDIHEFAGLLNQHPTKTNQTHSVNLNNALNIEIILTVRINELKRVFIKDNSEPRLRKESAAQVKSMGELSQKRFLDLHNKLSDTILLLQDRERRCLTLITSTAWYVVGNRYIEHYQKIKVERRLLDFTDLEWKTYQLLNSNNNAHWIQYKLDQRIDHILIDEFQDTNPTQWHMLLPLLQELAAGDSERKRSVFLVGDIKQSIYQFRRADPKLFKNASNWLNEHFSAQQFPLDMSWRSAPAIIDFVNKTFGDDDHKMIPSFRIHTAKHHQLWGRVELLPLIESTPKLDIKTPDQLRNPLHQPRVIDEDLRYSAEGKLIAERIRSLINNKTIINHPSSEESITYNDIIILVRSRTHVHAYEKALRELDIPYIGGSKTTLLDCLEIQDMVMLLENLITPYDNLSLAKALRSPLFDCSDLDLIEIARFVKATSDTKKAISWFDNLPAIADSAPKDSPLKNAYKLLAQWHGMVGKRPVHDLLDRIYSEGNVIARYESAFPEHLKLRVKANLSRFIELALEVDSGRYPSLPHFLSQLRKLQVHAEHAIDEPPVLDGQAAVRIMTIHAAKGLESPVVFIADAAHKNRRHDAYQALIDWPSTADRPNNFLLMRKKAELDSWSKIQLDKLEKITQTEQANLLYVALTRAKQLLFISGCAPNRRISINKTDLGWYGIITERVIDRPEDELYSGAIFESGQMSLSDTIDINANKVPGITPDPRLSRPVYSNTDDTENKNCQQPSELNTLDSDDNNAKIRGTAIHRMLELFTANDEQIPDDILKIIADELGIHCEDKELKSWWQEAHALTQDPKLQAFFDPVNYTTAYNEVPIQYTTNNQPFMGIIDRLVLTDDKVVILDYKTQQNVSAENLAELAKPYRKQIDAYRKGIREIYPDKELRAYLLFTTNTKLYEIKDSLAKP